MRISVCGPFGGTDFSRPPAPSAGRAARRARKHDVTKRAPWMRWGEVGRRANGGVGRCRHEAVSKGPPPPPARPTRHPCPPPFDPARCRRSAPSSPSSPWPCRDRPSQRKCPPSSTSKSWTSARRGCSSSAFPSTTQWKSASGGDYEDLPAIRQRTLVAWGRRDKIEPPKNDRILARRIPRATAHAYRNTGHAFMSQLPVRIGVLIRRFLS